MKGGAGVNTPRVSVAFLSAGAAHHERLTRDHDGLWGVGDVGHFFSRSWGWVPPPPGGGGRRGRFRLRVHAARVPHRLVVALAIPSDGRAMAPSVLGLIVPPLKDSHIFMVAYSTLLCFSSSIVPSLLLFLLLLQRTLAFIHFPPPFFGTIIFLALCLPHLLMSLPRTCPTLYPPKGTTFFCHQMTPGGGGLTRGDSPL